MIIQNWRKNTERRWKRGCKRRELMKKGFERKEEK
jgi:hypothetical protein